MKKGMKDVTVEHLLTMRAGVKFDELSSFFHRDWCRSYMGSELSFAPGTEFTYNSLNSYMLAAIIKEKTGRSLLTYLQEKLFDAMDIHDITWDKCPQGIEKGGCLKNSRPKRGYIQVICYSSALKTVDITGFFKKFCITTRTMRSIIKGSEKVC